MDTPIKSELKPPNPVPREPEVELELFSPVSGSIGTRNEFVLSGRVSITRGGCRLNLARLIVFEGVIPPMDPLHPGIPQDPSGPKREMDLLPIVLAGGLTFSVRISGMLFQGANTIKVLVGVTGTGSVTCNSNSARYVTVGFVPEMPNLEYSFPVLPSRFL